MVLHEAEGAMKTVPQNSGDRGETSRLLHVGGEEALDHRPIVTTDQVEDPVDMTTAHHPGRGVMMDPRLGVVALEEEIVEMSVITQAKPIEGEVEMTQDFERGDNWCGIYVCSDGSFQKTSLLLKTASSFQ
jgi:hypothetical protein